MTEFGMVTQVGEQHVSRGSAMPPFKGGGVPVSAILILHGAHRMRNNNQILHGDQTTCGEKFYRATTNQRSVCGT